MGIFNKKNNIKENNYYKISDEKFSYNVCSFGDESHVFEANYEDLNDKIEKYVYNFKSEEENNFALINKLKNIIEKVAIWYEIRYSNDTLLSIIPLNFEEKSVYETMFAGKSDVSISSYLNYSFFFNSLSDDEQKLLGKIDYPKSLLWDDYRSKVLLDEKGFITNASFIENAIPGVDLTNLEGCHIMQLLNNIVGKGIRLEKGRNFKKLYTKYNDAQNLKNVILNYALYKIIERGEPGFGARRAILFAREFGLNMDVAMEYGLSSQEDEGLIKYYLDCGGNPDIVCYIDYVNRTKKYTKLKTMNLKDIYKK